MGVGWGIHDMAMTGHDTTPLHIDTLPYKIMKHYATTFKQILSHFQMI